MPAVASTLADLTARRSTPAAPLITFYDVSTGERVELSGTTMANWVAKTSNFLVDDLDAEVGTRLRIGLPSHWLRQVWLLSAWNVGAVVVADAAEIGVSGPELVADEPRRVAASLRPLGGPFAEEPDGFLDMTREVPGHSDHFVGFDPPAPSSTAVELPGRTATHAELLDTVSPDPRRLLLGPRTLLEDAEALIAACTGDGSLVVVTSGTADEIARIADQESAEPIL